MNLVLRPDRVAHGLVVLHQVMALLRYPDRLTCISGHSELQLSIVSHRLQELFLVFVAERCRRIVCVRIMLLLAFRVPELGQLLGRADLIGQL